VIRQAEIDLSTGKYKSELKDIWTGSGGIVPEGPHLYKKDGKYWLLIAEGGTFRGHKITMARSDSVWGPYESYEKNPILTDQGPDHTIQCVGHGELFTDTNGEWWCTMLARRGRGDAYPLGRETYLVPASWPKNEFPSLDQVELQQIVSPDSRNLPKDLLMGGINPVPKAVSLNMPQNLFLRTPDFANYYEDAGRAHLILTATPTELGSTTGSPTFVGRRQVGLESRAIVVLDLTDLPDGHCGLSVYKDTYRHASLDVNGSKELSLAIAHHSQKLMYTESRSVEKATSVKLIITSSVEAYVFSYDLLQEGNWQGEVEIGTVPASDMSGNDFTGTVYGVYASGDKGKAHFYNFEIINES
jgi:beta-xylosidase